MVNRSEVEREIWADELLDRLTPVMSALSVLFVLVVIGESFATSGTTLSLGLTVAGWLIWLTFVAEFIARLVVAPKTVEFLKRNWWQVAFLVLPFLRILRLIRTIRILRAGRVLSSAVRSSRSAHRVLRSRVGWLAVVSAITALGSSQLLYTSSRYSIGMEMPFMPRPWPPSQVNLLPNRMGSPRFSTWLSPRTRS